jgi:hypothetical protein
MRALISRKLRPILRGADIAATIALGCFAHHPVVGLKPTCLLAFIAPEWGLSHSFASLDSLHRKFSFPAKTDTIATPESASLTSPRRSWVARLLGDFLIRNANSALDASPPPQEIGQDDDVSPPLNPEMTGSHLTGRALKPIIRTALLLLESSSLLGHAHEQQRRTSPDEILSSSRALRFSWPDPVRFGARPASRRIDLSAFSR